MKSLLLYNDTNSVMTLMLEPIGRYFDVSPKTRVSIVGTFSDEEREYGEIAIHPENFVVVWTSLDAVVMQDGNVLERNKDR